MCLQFINAASGLKQIVIWPGGKKKELKNILANVPSYDRFFEPFVGGGSVFMGINAREHYINDFSTSLISLYKNIATSNEQFHHYLAAIDMSMVKAGNSLADIRMFWPISTNNTELMSYQRRKWKRSCQSGATETNVKYLTSLVSSPYSLALS